LSTSFPLGRGGCQHGLRSVKQVRVQFCSFEKNLGSTRTFHQVMSSEKVRCTNLNCSVIVDVRHNGSEPCVARGLAAHTTQEMLTAFASHIQAKGTAGSRDKPSASARR
uniref:Large ribosomal subunit protein mL53 n=1 Tax=Moschus moschiferus TaxID=68415 RepID=A0A8C6E215_MOSMO